MSQKLRTLVVLLATGITAAGVGFSLWNPRAGVTLAQLNDAGLSSDCAARIASCEVRLGPGARRVLLDAGFDDAGLSKYNELEFVVAACPLGDGGFDLVLPPWVDNDNDGIIFRPEDCRLRLCATDPTFCAQRKPRPGTPQCAYRAQGTPLANCRRRNLRDGGLVNAGVGNVMTPAEAVGAGCTPSVCTVTDAREAP